MCKQEYLKVYQLQLRKCNRKSNVQGILRGCSLGCFPTRMSCSPLHAALPHITPYHLMPTMVYYTHFLTYFLHPTVLLEATSPATSFLTSPEINTGMAHFNSHRIWDSVTKIKAFFSLPTPQIPASVLTERDVAEWPSAQHCHREQGQRSPWSHHTAPDHGRYLPGKKRLFQPSLLELESFAT